MERGKRVFMKVDISLDLDWIEWDGGFEDTIKKEVVDTIVKRITDKIEKQLLERVTEIVNSQCDTICKEMVNTYLDKPVNITDKWGDNIIVGTTIKSIIQKRFDDFWNTKIDAQGRVSTEYNSNDCKNRVQWSIDEIIKEHSKEFNKTLVNDTANKIKANMTESLRNAIGSKLIGELGFDKLLKLT
jgi:hypothetical protein